MDHSLPVDVQSCKLTWLYLNLKWLLLCATVREFQPCPYACQIIHGSAGGVNQAVRATQLDRGALEANEVELILSIVSRYTLLSFMAGNLEPGGWVHCRAAMCLQHASGGQQRVTI